MLPSIPWTTDENGPEPLFPLKTAIVCRICAWARTARLRVMAAHASARVSKDFKLFMHILQKCLPSEAARVLKRRARERRGSPQARSQRDYCVTRNCGLLFSVTAGVVTV